MLISRPKPEEARALSLICLRYCWTKSISHHLTNPGMMIRQQVKSQPTMVSPPVRTGFCNHLQYLPKAHRSGERASLAPHGRRRLWPKLRALRGSLPRPFSRWSRRWAGYVNPGLSRTPGCFFRGVLSPLSDDSLLLEGKFF